MIFHGQPVTVDRVKEAYDKIGFSPEPENWINTERGTCCGISALVLADGLYTPEAWQEALKSGYNAHRVAEKLNMDGDELLAFVCGFDGEPPESNFAYYALDTDGWFKDRNLADAFMLGKTVAREVL